MNVGGVTTNVPIGYKANKSTQLAGMDFSTHFNNVAKKGHTVYMKTDDMLYSGGNGTGLSFYIKYAESSTKENPTVVAKGVDENGEEFEQTIHINDINPTNATLVEMRALEAYLGVEKYAGFDSLPKVPFGAGQMGLHDRADFMTMFRKQISDMTLLRQQKAAEYYRYSMQAYEGFKGHMERKTENISFLDTISANLTEKTGTIRLEDMWKSKYPGAYYHVMDGSKISQATWDRNDFPFEKFFSDDVDESILEWRPAGAEPSDYDSTVITRRNSVAGQKAVIVHPALEEKMKNNPELAEKVMQNVENWIATYPAEPGCSYLIELNENGGISKYCVTGPLRISHSVTETGREKVDKLHEEYERIARENAMKRGLQQQTAKKDVGSATAEYKEKHPEQAGRVNGQIRAGQNVIRKFGAENVSREDMTMEEYKAFFTALMNSIPYDASQQGDVNVWSITEAGWEQMKNDPDYEAWVLGYTAQDRAVHNPFAAMPGYSPGFHTEHFGASIDEHIGQSMPMGASSRSRFDDGETWWEWRQKRMKALSQNLLMRSYFLN